MLHLTALAVAVAVFVASAVSTSAVDGLITKPSAYPALSSELSAARLVVLEESGHFPTLEQPAQATRAVREWLTRIRLRPAG